MLAPRKTLWSTPTSAIDHLQRWIPLQAGDCVCDVGCGDGRVVLQWAEKCSQQEGISFLGIDIDSERIRLCQESLDKAREEGTIAESLDIRFVCANALQSAELLGEANIFFLYLIPRGLKIFHPMLLEHKERHNKRPLKVVTYMSKLPGETPIERALCKVEHQPGAEWPLYFYNL
jgi:SAM-dependent methyltransferase